MQETPRSPDSLLRRLPTRVVGAAVGMFTVLIMVGSGLTFVLVVVALAAFAILVASA